MNLTERYVVISNPFAKPIESNLSYTISVDPLKQIVLILDLNPAYFNQSSITDDRGLTSSEYDFVQMLDNIKKFKEERGL